jgi:hypothetical protein
LSIYLKLKDEMVQSLINPNMFVEWLRAAMKLEFVQLSKLFVGRGV